MPKALWLEKKNNFLEHWQAYHVWPLLVKIGPNALYATYPQITQPFLKSRNINIINSSSTSSAPTPTTSNIRHCYAQDLILKKDLTSGHCCNILIHIPPAHKCGQLWWIVAEKKHICCDRDYLSTYCNNNLQDRSGILDIFLINLSHCDVRGLKNVFFMPFTPPLFQKYPSTMRAACAISEIYSTMRGLCYFRNIHPLLDEQQ